MTIGSASESEGGRDSAPDSVRATGALRLVRTLALFVGSGAAGLVDQVCFSKYLSYVVGATAYAVSTVLAAFMTGLALGAHFGGKVSLRIARPVVLHGWLELVGLLALAVAL